MDIHGIILEPQVLYDSCRVGERMNTPIGLRGVCDFERRDGLLFEATDTVTCTHWQIGLIVRRVSVTHSAKAKDISLTSY